VSISDCEGVQDEVVASHVSEDNDEEMKEGRRRRRRRRCWKC
jgi:hypothetical protein